MHAVALKRIRIYDELAAQVRRILDAGLEPTHLDTHKHTHLLPPVLDAVARISEEFEIPWVRRPVRFSAARRGRHRLGEASGQPEHAASCAAASSACWRGMAAARRITSRDSRSPGTTTPRIWLQLIRALPEGSTEFMCHPGLAARNCAPRARA